MTPTDRKAKAEELAEDAGRIHAAAAQASADLDGIDPAIHEALFREMQAVSTLAQVHATLASVRPELAIRLPGAAEATR